MFNNHESIEFLGTLRAQVAHEVQHDRKAVHAAVEYVIQINRAARLDCLFSTKLANQQPISSEMASAGAGAQWAQEQGTLRAFGARMQKSRDEVLSEINAEQYRKRTAAYARNKAAQQPAD